MMKRTSSFLIGLGLSAVAGCASTGIADSIARGRPTSNFPKVWESPQVAAAAAPPPIGPAPPASAAGASALVAATPQPASYALIIGVERYRDLPAAIGAVTDAKRMTEVMRRTLGLSEEHVHTLLDDRATRADVVGELNWLERSVPPGGRVYFFFSGHGAPNADESTYLLPFDGNSKNIGESGIPMAEVNRRLGQTKAREVLAMFDSCFSGAGGRSVLPKGARALMRVKEATPAPQMATFSASASDEISGVAAGEATGVFTKYVVDGLGGGHADINGDGQVSLQELSEFVSVRVAREAKREGREQHPRLVLGSSASTAENFVVEYGLPSK